MPIFRSLVAKELVQTYGLTQLQAAMMLGTTQAAVSQYVNSKRGFKGAFSSSTTTIMEKS